MGVLGIALMFAVTRLATQSLLVSIAAAAMLALTPGLFIHSRYAMDYHYPVPFILGWLYCLLRFDLTRRLPWLIAACVILGVGFYCYISSIVMMPVYFVMTLMWLYMRREPARSFAAATAGMVPLLVPFLIWIALHPQAYSATVDKYGLYNSNELNPVQGLRSAFSFLSVGQRLSQYWNYYDPSLLFFGSGIKVQFSTNLVGVFLLPMAFFMLLGIVCGAAPASRTFLSDRVAGVRDRADRRGHPDGRECHFPRAGPAALRRAACRCRPAAAVATCGAAIGAARLPGGRSVGPGCRHRLRSWCNGSCPLPRCRWPSLAPRCFLPAVSRGRSSPCGCWQRRCLLLLPLQFAAFWNDYFSSYRERVSFWLGGNIRGALEQVIRAKWRRCTCSCLLHAAQVGQRATRLAQRLYRFVLALLPAEASPSRPDGRARARSMRQHCQESSPAAWSSPTSRTPRRPRSSAVARSGKSPRSTSSTASRSSSSCKNSEPNSFSVAALRSHPTSPNSDCPKRGEPANMIRL